MFDKLPSFLLQDVISDTQMESSTALAIEKPPGIYIILY